MRILNAVGVAYAGILGEEYLPVAAAVPTVLRLGPPNRAMTGNGRLRFGTVDPTGDLWNTGPGRATAAARLLLDPNSCRRQLWFWHDGRSWGGAKAIAEMLIDGRSVWQRPVGDRWWQGYLNGSEHQGVIDLTDLLAGADQVELTFLVHAGPVGVTGRVELNLDRIETIGLRLDNPDFEDAAGWTVTSDGSLEALVALY